MKFLRVAIIVSIFIMGCSLVERALSSIPPITQPPIQITINPESTTLPNPSPSSTLRINETATRVVTAIPSPSPSSTPMINQTTSGVISKNETWRGDVLITGDITIEAGATLTIEPGTTVHFTAQNDDIHGGDDQDLAIPERKNFPNDPPGIPTNMIVLEITPGGETYCRRHRICSDLIYFQQQYSQSK